MYVRHYFMLHDYGPTDFPCFFYMRNEFIVSPSLVMSCTQISLFIIQLENIFTQYFYIMHCL